MDLTTGAIDHEQLTDTVAGLRAPGCPETGEVRVGPFDLEYRRPRALATALELLFGKGIYDVDRLAEPQLVIDGGSWLGLSVLRLRQLFPAATVIAFEPDPEIVPILRRNLDRNGAGDVLVVDAALAGRVGPATFRSTGSDNGGFNPGIRGREITVERRRLSEFVTGPVSLLKLNIEGAEAEVIDELGDLLGTVDQVLIEYHGFAELPQSLHRILAKLDTHGLTYVVSHFDERNQACVPPLRLDHDYRYFLLIYARRLGL